LKVSTPTAAPKWTTTAVTLSYNRSMGDHKAIMLLADFQDVTHLAGNNQSKYDAFANANGSSDRSLRTFYYVNSAGNYTVNTTVVDWVTMPHNLSYYTTSSGENQIAVDAANAANSAVDFSQFDEDGDGYVDNLIVVHAGNDQAVTGNTSDIWSFEGAGNTVTLDNKTIQVFTTVAEESANGDPLGVVCHEFGHLAFDLPDLYDVDLVNAGLGDWDTMAYGGWGGGGDYPNQYSAWTKLRLGWIDPFVPTEPVETYTIYPMTNASSRNPIKIESNYTNEYFLVEFRWKNVSLRYDRYLPVSGLVIYHVDENTVASKYAANTIETTTSHKGIDIEEVGTQDMDSSATNTGSSNDVWVNNANGFTPSSSPNSSLYRNNGSYATGIKVYNISAVNTSGGPHITFSIDPGRGSFALQGQLLNNNSTLEAPAGASVNFTVQFTTASQTGDNVSVAVEGSFGNATVALNRTNLTLSASGSGTVNLTVTLPSNCTGGEFVDVLVRANSTSHPSNTAAVMTRTVCAQTFLANITGPSTFNATSNVTVSQNFTVQNTGNGPDNFTITAVYNASLINISVPPQGFLLAGGASRTFQVNFTVGASVADGTSVPFTIRAAFGPAGGRLVQFNGTVTARNYTLLGAVLSGSPQSAAPGASANFTVQFTTSSSTGDIVALSWEGSPANATVSLNRTNLTLGALGSGAVTLTVTVPGSCLAGDLVDIRVRANSTTQTTITVAVLTRTICAQAYAANLTGPASINATSNVTISQNFTVRNSGNGADNFTIAAVFNASLLNVSVPSQVFTLASAASVTIQVNFTVAASVADGTAIPFTIQAAFGPAGGRLVQFNGTVTARNYTLVGAVLSGSPQSALPGASANFTVQFTTASSVGDTVNLSWEGVAANATVGLNRTNLALGALGSGTVTLSVTLPGSCLAGDVVDILVRANSTNQPTITVAVATRAICAQAFAANLTGPVSANATSDVTLSQNFTVRNTGNGADNFTIAAIFNASLLNISVPSQVFTLVSGASLTFQVNFTVGASVADGTAVLFTIQVAFGPAFGRLVQFNGTVTARNYSLVGAVLSGSPQVASPGAFANFTVEFTTSSSTGDTVALSWEGSPVNATVALNRTNLTLSALGSGTVTLTVTLAGDCQAGDASDIRVRANSTGQPSMTIAVPARTLCAQVYLAEVTGPSSFNATANVTASQDFAVRNAGNGADNVTLTAIYNASLIDISLPSQAFLLARGASATIAVNFTVDASVLALSVIPFTLDLAFGPSLTLHAYLNGTVTAGGVASLSLQVDALAVETLDPGVPRRFNLTLQNDGNAPASVNLTGTAPLGVSVAFDNTSAQVAALSSTTIGVTLTADANASAGLQGPVSLVAAMASPPAQAVAFMTVRVNQWFDAALAGPDAFNATPTVVISKNFTIHNAGNGLDNFTFSATFASSSIDITLPTQSLSLDGGASGTFQVDFTVAGTVMAGTPIAFTIDVAYGPLGARHIQFNGTATAGRLSLAALEVQALPVETLDPGVARRFNVTVRNDGNYLADVDLSTTAPAGVSVTWDSTTVQVGAFSSMTVGVTVTADPQSLAGVQGDVVFRATLLTPPSQAVASFAIVVSQWFEVTLQGPTSTGAAPGDMVALNLTAINLGNGADNVALEVSTSALGWNPTATPSFATLGPTNATRSADVLFQATVPSGAAANSQAEFNVLLISQKAGVSATLTIVVLVLQDLSFTITVNGPPGPIAASQVAAFAVTVVNTGNVADSYAVTAQGLPTGWSATPAAGAAATLGPGEGATMWLNLTTTASALAGTYPFQIAAVAQSNASQRAVLAQTVEIAARHEVQLLLAGVLGQFLPGAKVTVNLTLRNLGNGPEPVGLVGAGNFAAVSFAPLQVTVPPFGQAGVSVTVTLRGDQPPGDATLSISAMANSNGSVVASGVATIHVAPAPPPPPPPANNTTVPPNNQTTPPPASNTTVPPTNHTSPAPQPNGDNRSEPPLGIFPAPLSDATGILLLVAVAAGLGVVVAARRRRQQ
jgi:immune inhibitor A